MGKLWYGGSIYTLQNENHLVESVYTEGNMIIKVGEMKELEHTYKESISEKVDLQGKTMIPGLVDSHMHLIGHGETLIRLDLSSLTSKEDVLIAVKKYSEQIEHGAWVIGEGWNENLWVNPEPLHREELDKVIQGHPILLKRVCRHALVANSMALKQASITMETECPPGGVIEKDSTGRLTGLLKDQAQDLLFRILPAVSENYLHRAMTAAIKNLYKFGVTGAHTEDLNYYGSYKDTVKTFKRVIEEDGLKFRAHLLVHHGVIDESYKDGNYFQSGNEWIEFGAMKIFADGALGGRTALLSHPYHDAPETSGVAIFSQIELKALVDKARKLELPVAIHAIGDLAFEFALNAIEAHPLKGKGRDRLIHAQILRKELIDRANKLPLILDIQPRFLSSDFPWVIDRVGQNHMEYCYAWKTLLSEGLHCAGGSDAPIEDANPMYGIYAAVSRKSNNNNDDTVYQPNERLSVYEAVSLFTKGSAYAVCHEHDRGMIQEGYLADFTVLEEDIFQIDCEKLPSIRAMMTVIGGERVFERL
jgi:predicted amidohydrolase YtcJ